jgi:hypothetical protein
MLINAFLLHYNYDTVEKLFLQYFYRFNYDLRRMIENQSKQIALKNYEFIKSVFMN